MPFAGTDNSVMHHADTFSARWVAIFSVCFMPIITPSDLPVNTRLEKAGISVISEQDALHQDIRPLQLAILNLMPDKPEAEYQLARLIGATSLQVQLTFLHTATHESKYTTPEYLAQFYASLDKVYDRKFDGFIMTGAPVEEMEFSDVNYWKELEKTMDWVRDSVYARLYICWGAQAALHHQYGINKHPIGKKASGIIKHHATLPNHPLARGFDDRFDVPVSRYTEIRKNDVAQIDELNIVAESVETGLYLVQSTDGRDTYCFNHPEYDTLTLNGEYRRDLLRYEEAVREGKNPRRVEMPSHYYPWCNPENLPTNTWRSHAQTLYRNWVDSVYAGTSFTLEDISKKNP